MAEEIKNGNMHVEEGRPMEAVEPQDGLRDEQPLPDRPRRRNVPDQERAAVQQTEEERLRQVRRLELLNDVPETIRKSLSSSSSSVALTRPVTAQDRQQMLREDDVETIEESNIDEDDAEESMAAPPAAGSAAPAPVAPEPAVVAAVDPAPSATGSDARRMAWDEGTPWYSSISRASLDGVSHWCV
eukprot:Skav211302  [mRNA]  locus=scaffold1052:252680:256564:- [translate_table: standard]